MNDQIFKHSLGDKGKDRVTGLVGIIVSRSESLYGCARYWIQPQECKDGKPAEGCWLDQESIDVVEAGAVKPPTYARVVVEQTPQAEPLRRAGGPTSQPASQTGPSTR